MNQYLDAAIKAARAAGALVRENFGRPLKVNVEEAHDMKLELDVRSQALITDYQSTRAPINILRFHSCNTVAHWYRSICHERFLDAVYRCCHFCAAIRCRTLFPVDKGCVEAEPLGRWLPLLHEWVLDIP
jgi:hypothetical protein